MTESMKLEPFQREERYIVIKRKHLTALQERALRAHMNRLGIGTVECVVVESDWPEYETVWRMIEDRMTGRHQLQREAVLEEALRVAKREIQSLGCDPDDIELALNRINRAALATPVPAVTTDEIVAVLEPFANAARRINHFDGESYNGALYACERFMSFRELFDGIEGEPLTVSHLRRAHAILSRLRGEVKPTKGGAA